MNAQLTGQPGRGSDVRVARTRATTLKNNGDMALHEARRAGGRLCSAEDRQGVRGGGGAVA